MQVHHDLVLIFETTNKIIKLQNNHSMAMDCKTVFMRASDNVNANMSKTMMPYGKNNYTVKNKHSKHNARSGKPLTPSTSAIDAYAFKNKHFVKSVKMKRLAMKNAMR